jgi:hypothetical protein
MRYKHPLVIASMLLCASLAAAVTWQASSAPFTFPGVGVKNGAAGQSVDFVYRYSAVRGIIDINCSLPRQSTGARLYIHSINGKAIKSFSITPNSRNIRWNAAADNTPAGVYVATLSSGAMKKSIRLMLSGKGGN